VGGTPGPCEPIHEESLSLSELEFRVFRCSWGWCVKRGDAAFRSRTLLEAFEEAWGTRLDEAQVRLLLTTIERALDAEYARKSATVSTTVSLAAHDAQYRPALSG
jgi:hypothetical protein